MVEGARLEVVYAERYRGFESPSLRVICYVSKLQTAAVRKDFLEMSGAMQGAFFKPRQIRKKAAVERLFLCRRFPDFSKRFLPVLRARATTAAYSAP